MPESKINKFNHLKIHTQYSICEGAIKIDSLKDFSKENRIRSVAICDTSNLCGALEFAEKISSLLHHYNQDPRLHLLDSLDQLALLLSAFCPPKKQ